MMRWYRPSARLAVAGLLLVALGGSAGVARAGRSGADGGVASRGGGGRRTVQIIKHTTSYTASERARGKNIGKSSAGAVIEDSLLTEDQINKEIVSNQLKLKYFRSLGTNINDEPDVLNLLLNWQNTYPSYSKYCTTPHGLGPVVTKEVETLASLDNIYPEVRMGGRYSPKNCSASSKVAIIVPFRGGEKNLATFLNHMHRFLMKQNVEYGIFVIRQSGGPNGEDHNKFNRGKLMNVGFRVAKEALLRSNGSYWDCYVFHDVDLLPLDTRNLYSCSPQPRRMSVAIDSLEPIGPYRIFFHRVLMLPHRHFLSVNGFSNIYWGFAGVFDDMNKRLKKRMYEFHNFPRKVARYKLQRKVTPEISRLKYLHHEMQGFEQDGLSTTKYSIVEATQQRLFSYIVVDLNSTTRENVMSKRRGYSSEAKPAPAATPPLTAILQTVEPFNEDSMASWHTLLATFKETYPFEKENYCQRPMGLGPVKPDKTLDNLRFISMMFPEVKKGGIYSPDNCVSRFKVAIIVPYRKRQENLVVFLKHMHWFLMTQKLEYGLFVIEQTYHKKFNRGKLMNVGYMVAKVAGNDSWDCYVFHDVDLLPLDTRNLYSCSPQPRHMSIAIDKFNYTSNGNAAFGGASSMTSDQFQEINGFPNRYWGWGGEDDDIYFRLMIRGYDVAQFPMSIGRYTMLNHTQQAINPVRFQQLQTARALMNCDGLSNLNYEINRMNHHHLFTRVLVSI